MVFIAVISPPSGHEKGRAGRPLEITIFDGLSILLYAGCSQAGNAVALNRALPGHKFFG